MGVDSILEGNPSNNIMSTIDFRARIRKSLTNNSLQAALDVNAERRVTRRISALQALPDWKERRQQAHAIRADVI